MSDIPAEVSREDLIRVIERDRFVKAQMSDRIAAMVRENLELLSIVQELQRDLNDVRQSEQMMFDAANTNGEVQQQQLIPD